MAVLPCLSKRPSARYQSETREKRRPARSVVASINLDEFSHGLLDFRTDSREPRPKIFFENGLFCPFIQINKVIVIFLLSSFPWWMIEEKKGGKVMIPLYYTIISLMYALIALHYFMQ